jgi:thiol:disulfide interchange protein
MASVVYCHTLQQKRTALVSRPPAAFPSLQQRHPRLPRRPAAATSAAVRAAQKKVYRSFHDMIHQSKEPVLVEFYATWCG